MSELTQGFLFKLCIFIAIGYIGVADGQASEFSFSDCNEIVSEAKLTEILKHKTVYGEEASDSDSAKNSSQPMELGKPLKKSTDAVHGTAECVFAGPMKGGKGITADFPIFTGSIRICTSNIKSQFAAFTSKNTDNLKTFHQSVIEESSEIGKATIVNKLKMGPMGESLSVKFLDADADVFVDVSINEVKMSSRRSKSAPSTKSLENVLQKVKDIAIEVEKKVK